MLRHAFSVVLSIAMLLATGATHGQGDTLKFGVGLYTRHQAIQTQVTRGELDAGADYNRNRDAMIAEGLICRLPAGGFA